MLFARPANKQKVLSSAMRARHPRSSHSPGTFQFVVRDQPVLNHYVHTELVAVVVEVMNVRVLWNHRTA